MKSSSKENQMKDTIITKSFNSLKKRKCVFLQHLVMIFMAILYRTHIHIQHAPSYFVMASQSVWLIPLSIWNYSKSSDGMWCFMIIEDTEWVAENHELWILRKEDLAQVVKWLRQRLGENAIIGIHGESMGAVTTLLYASKPEASANFYIADCPFASFEDQLLYRLKTDFRLSGQWILPLSDRVLKWRDGYSIRQVSPLDVIDQVKEPVLFIHSLHDDYIPCEQSQQLYARKKGDKQLFIAPHGAHAMSFSENKAAYEQEVQGFLQQFESNEDKRGEWTAVRLLFWANLCDSHHCCMMSARQLHMTLFRLLLTHDR